MKTIVLELSCGCQVKASLQSSNWAMVRRCKAIMMPSPQLYAIQKDHYHLIEARLNEVRGAIQGQ